MLTPQLIIIISFLYNQAFQTLQSNKLLQICKPVFKFVHMDLVYKAYKFIPEIFWYIISEILP